MARRGALPIAACTAGQFWVHHLQAAGIKYNSRPAKWNIGVRNGWTWHKRRRSTPQMHLRSFNMVSIQPCRNYNVSCAWRILYHKIHWVGYIAILTEILICQIRVEGWWRGHVSREHVTMFGACQSTVSAPNLDPKCLGSQTKTAPNFIFAGKDIVTNKILQWEEEKCGGKITRSCLPINSKTHYDI